MFTHQFFNIILELTEDWVVREVIPDHESQDINIKVEHVGNKALCPVTKELCKKHDHANERSWRHLDTMQYKTYIHCRLPRVRNKHGAVKTVPPPWASKHERHTYLFECATIDLLQSTKNQTRTAELMRCGFNVIIRIVKISTERGLRRRELDDESLTHLSIDEKSFRKGHEYVSVLSHPESGVVLDIEPGRTKGSARDLLSRTLTGAQKEKTGSLCL
ncbi:MAG: transposase family protein [Flavobacteriales bacterium]